jgi:endonuclease YncB( thermonuclease family)
MPTTARRTLVIGVVVAMIPLWWLILPDRDPVAVPGGDWQVESVVDGDTVRVVRGTTEETVRLIGIDTPERDQCGYDEATRFMVDLVLDQPVTLVDGATTDRDNYGRLLRYVEHEGIDVGLAQITEGYAMARYDSRTNQPHPREDVYREADASTAHFCE